MGRANDMIYGVGQIVVFGDEHNAMQCIIYMFDL